MTLISLSEIPGKLALKEIKKLLNLCFLKYCTKKTFLCICYRADLQYQRSCRNKTYQVHLSVTNIDGN